MLNTKNSAALSGAAPEVTSAMVQRRVVRAFCLRGRVQAIGKTVALHRLQAIEFDALGKTEPVPEKPEK